MSKSAPFTIDDLADVIMLRKSQKAADSYTAMLVEKGPVHVCKKLQEEVLEAAIESSCGNRDRVTNELADIVFHMLVLASCHGITLREIEKCLGRRHKMASRATSAKLYAARLAKREMKLGKPSSEVLFTLCGLAPSSAADVVLFSHTLNPPNKGKTPSTKVFSVQAKELKTKLQRDGIKVKLAVPPDSEERFVARRADAFVIPLLFVANTIILPICLNILASFIKDAFDRLAKSKEPKAHTQKVQILLGVAASGERKEKWYIFEGTLREVLREIGDVVERSGLKHTRSRKHGQSVAGARRSYDDAAQFRHLKRETNLQKALGSNGLPKSSPD